MRRRDRTGGKVKARRHKASAPKAVRRRSPSPTGGETNVARLSRELSKALEQQAATAEILNVISNSPTDTQPVFDAIVQSGLKLFPGALVSVALRYGDMINAAAVAAADPARVEAWRRTISRTPPRAELHARRSLARSQDREYSRRGGCPGGICSRGPKLPDQRQPRDHDHARPWPGWLAKFLRDFCGDRLRSVGVAVPNGVTGAFGQLMKKQRVAPTNYEPGGRGFKSCRARQIACRHQNGWSFAFQPLSLCWRDYCGLLRDPT